MKYCLLPIAHGVEVNKIPQNYAQPLIDGINNLLTDEERGFLIPLPYDYTDKTNDRQMQMFNAVEQGLDNAELRRLKHTVGSDVTWSFIIAKAGGECFYTDFVQNVSAYIDQALAKYPDAKICCVGHSQGTQLLYSFLFDYPRQVDAFISMGSPISMNSGAYPDFGKIPPNLKSWWNFYNDMDFVSSRLQDVHPSEAIASFVNDFKVPLGWNPIFHLPEFLSKFQLLAALEAHCIYWKSDFVYKKIAGKIKELIHS